MDVPRNATNLKLHSKLKDNNGDAITGVTFDDPSLTVESWVCTDTIYQPIDLVDGSVGTFLASSWDEIGLGEYQFCPANSLIVPGRSTTIRVTYDSNDPIYGTINAVGDDGTSSSGGSSEGVR